MAKQVDYGVDEVRLVVKHFVPALDSSGFKVLDFDVEWTLLKSLVVCGVGKDIKQLT